MYNFVSLNLKCPTCGKSLMDTEHLIDNEKSIKLNIAVGDKKGVIYLSSIYGSYNHDCNIDVKMSDIASFTCHHCNAEIKGKTICETCAAPMVTFNLDMGGKVAICTRYGCKNHFVEFEDLALALQKLYQEHSFNGRTYPFHAVQEPENKQEPATGEAIEILPTGTFLQSYCPHCRKSLNDNDALHLKVINNHESGYLMLSPYLNVFTSKSTIFVADNKVVNDLQCPHCDKTLMIPKKQCEICGSPIARVSLTARTKLLDFYICSKNGCHWHGLSEEDLYEIKLEDSLEW